MSLNSEGESYPLTQFRKTYFEECGELLDALQTNLDLLLNGTGDGDILNAIFRSVHSIKGGAGAFGFTALVAFSHVFESLLDAMREQKISATPDVMQMLLRASDALADIVGAARDEHQMATDFGADIIAVMEEALVGVSESQAEAAPAHAVPTEGIQVSGERRHRYRVHATFGNAARRPTSRCSWSANRANWGA